MKAIFFTLVCLLPMQSLLRADLVLDQSFTPPSTSLEFVVNVQVANPVEQAQSFTVGISGVLSQVDLKLRRTSTDTLSPLLFDIRTMNADLPTSANSGVNILTSQSISPFSLGTTFPGANDFVSITLLNPINVVAGQRLAIVLRSNQVAPAGSSVPGYGLFGVSPGSGFDYANGTSFTRTSAFDWTSNQVDVALRTFVAVPEPSSLLLMALASCIILPVRRVRPAS